MGASKTDSANASAVAVPNALPWIKCGRGSAAQQLRHDLATGPATHHNPLVQPESVQTTRAIERPLVLIIDEEQSARDLYGDWFFAQGFQVMCAVGVAGLSLALKRERPQLIVTELKARDLTLRDLTVRLRCEETTRCIPIIVLTSLCDVAALDSAKAAVAAAVLPKLVNFALLHSWVSVLWG